MRKVELLPYEAFGLVHLRLITRNEYLPLISVSSLNLYRRARPGPDDADVGAAHANDLMKTKQQMEKDARVRERLIASMERTGKQRGSKGRVPGQRPHSASSASLSPSI